MYKYKHKISININIIANPKKKKKESRIWLTEKNVCFQTQKCEQGRADGNRLLFSLLEARVQGRTREPCTVLSDTVKRLQVKTSWRQVCKVMQVTSKIGKKTVFSCLSGAEGACRCWLRDNKVDIFWPTSYTWLRLERSCTRKWADHRLRTGTSGRMRQRVLTSFPSVFLCTRGCFCRFQLLQWTLNISGFWDAAEQPPLMHPRFKARSYGSVRYSPMFCTSCGLPPLGLLVFWSHI